MSCPIMREQSGFSQQLRIVTKWTNVVLEAGEIHKYDLMDKLQITITQYNQLKGYVEHKQDGIIEYDKRTGLWKIATQQLNAAYENELKSLQ